ncbi:MAG: trigger factor [Deltaproteobacteria bacterium]
MNVNIETLSSVKKKINFIIPAERVGTEIDRVYNEIRKTTAIKGFRKGKVPQSFIEKNYSGKMAGEVLQGLVTETYLKALNDFKIIPVAPPTIESDELKKGEPLSYSATVEILPVIEPKEYIGLQAEKETYIPDLEAINVRLSEMQARMAQVVPLTEPRPAIIGDIITLDFKGFLDDVPFEKGEAEDYVLELGTKSFIEGFEEQLVGMSCGDEGKVKVTFPEAYGGHKLAGKEVTFEVKIKDIKQKELPELDDDFARQFGLGGIEEMKENIALSFEHQEKIKIDSALKDSLVKALIEKHELEVPEALVEKQLQFLVENTIKTLSAQNLTLEMIGTEESKLREELKDNARMQVKGSLLLEAIAKKEAIIAEDNEIYEKIQVVAEQTNKDSDHVEQFYLHNPNAKASLVKQILEEKAIQFLLEHAVITEVSKDKVK